MGDPESGTATGSAIRTIVAEQIDAVVFDLDGVITRTAAVHSAAWKQLFDEYLQQRAERLDEEFIPFDSDDYLSYVDGKPRYDGVASFLESRGIDLPWGTPDDPPGSETVRGLGSRKDEYFLDRLRTDGVEAFETSVQLVHELQHQGFGTALISSSRNVSDVLASADLSDLFPVIIDGIVASDLGIPGKPDPAVFLEATASLGAVPERTAIVEDALSGVRAGRDGGFAMVIGVDRADHAAELAADGATVTVPDLGELTVVPATPVPRAGLPDASTNLDMLARAIGDRKPAVFLDYDGTLTPIVNHPDDALLSDDTRDVTTELASLITVAVVSGRDVNDVRDKMRVEGIYYAGSHGFDIVGPDGEPIADIGLQDFSQYLGPLDCATRLLEARLVDVPGSQVERKQFAIAVHYRRVAESDEEAVRDAVHEVAPEVPELRLTTGKKVFELRPDFDWDKGRALDWLLRELDLFDGSVIPIYVGDDTTDEDAFRAIRNRGIGIVVGDDGDATFARWQVPDTDAVRSFLTAMIRRERGS